MKKNVALVLVGLGIGCGVGALAIRHASAQGYPMAPQAAPAPIAMAPQAAPAPIGHIWQQFCEQASSVQEASAIAGARGAQGFELVAIYNGVLCFKRPIPGSIAPPAPMPAPTGTQDRLGY